MPDGSVHGKCLEVIADIAKEHEEFDPNEWELLDNPQDDPTTITL